MNPYRTLLLNLGSAALMLASATAFADQNALPSGGSPTSVSITNSSNAPVYANIVLGQPPATLPPNCSNLGTQIQSLTDSNLVFTSSVAGKTVSFTLVPGVNDKGSYQMAAGETITYTPQTISCGSASCSPAVTFNYFFTPTDVGFKDNNGCSNSTFPNATNLAEASINFGVNGSVGAGCANADDTDISAVNGVNSILQVSTQDAGGNPQTGWPASTSLAKNAVLGKNANLPGVFGWAATNCSGNLANSGYPNPTKACAAPKMAPRASKKHTCTTPNGTQYKAIIGPKKTYYCDERSDAGTCNNQRQAYVTGGTVQILYIGPAY